MEKIIYKLKGFEFRASPFLMASLKLREARAEMLRARAIKTIRKWALEIDKEIMGM